MLKNPKLQSLRAFAVLLVILNHLEVPFFSGGFIGVDIFFVLSGYLITRSIIELEKKDNFSYLVFMVKRIKRLLPSVIAMVLLTIFSAKYFLHVDVYLTITESVLYALLWVSNIFFTMQEADYFQLVEVKDIFLHTWSLSVEEQFYVFWPLLILLPLRLKKSNVNVSLVFILVFIISLLSNILLSYSEHTTFSFYSVVTRMWQFALGALAISAATSKVGNHLTLPMAVVCYAVILITNNQLNDQSIYPGFAVLIPSIATFLIIIYSVKSKKSLSSKPNSIIQYIGDRSYSLYLFHWPITVIVQQQFIHSQVIEVLIVFITTFILAHANYRYVERPLWKSHYLSNKPERLFLLYVLILVITLSVVFIHLVKIEKRAYIEKEIAEKNLFHSSISQVYIDNCDSWFNSSVLAPCIYGNKSSEKEVIIFGDSVMLQWFTPLSELLVKDNWKIIVLTKSACPIVDITFYYKRINAPYDVCDKWKQQAYDYIKNKQPSLLIAGNSNGYSFSSTELQKALNKVTGFFSSNAKNVIITSGIPILSFSPNACLANQFKNKNKIDKTNIYNQHCFQEVNLNNHQKKSVLYNDIINRYPNTYYFDVTPIVCPKMICNTINTQGIMVYKNSSHITEEFAINQKLNIEKYLATLSSIALLLDTR